MAASTPAMSTRTSPGHRRSNSATNVSISAIASSVSSTLAASSNRNKTPAKAKAAMVKRRNSLSAGAIVNQEARVLAGVFAMVDVRMGQDAQIDCSDVVAEKMAELGAVIVKRFTPRVTHIVLSHLTSMWKDKIAKWQSNISVGLARRVDGRPELQIVSQLWVNDCYVKKTRMDEKTYFPVSKTTTGAGGVEGHLHLNGAMKQFVLANPTPTPAPVTIAKSTSNTPAPSRLVFSTNNNNSNNSASSTSINSTRANATANRRKTLDAKGVSEIQNSRKPTNNSNNSSTTTSATTAAAPTSRHAAIQFQFGAAAALAAATLGSQAVKRKRRALSMEPMASDAIQKLITTGSSGGSDVVDLVTPVKEDAKSANDGAKKKLDLDTILTPVSVEASSKRRPLSSAKRRKTMSEVPSATLTMPVHHQTPIPAVAVVSAADAAPAASVISADPNPQKKLFQDTPTSDCVAESQSDPEDEECKPSPALTEDLKSDIVAAPIATTVPANDEGVAKDDAFATEDASDAPTAATTMGVLEDTSISASTAAPTGGVAPAVAAKVSTTESKISSDLFSVGVSDIPARPVRSTRSGNAALTRLEVARKALATAPGVWKCSACGCSNTRARRLCKDCRASKTTADEVVLAKEVAATTRATSRKPLTAAVAPKTPSAPTRATRKLVVTAIPEPKTPSGSTRVKESAVTSPKASTAPGISSRRILTTPKTITKPAAPASRRQRVTPGGGAASKPTTAARKLPLAPSRTPSKPSSQTSESKAAAGSTGARSISVLEMTPVRVTERGSSKRSLSTSSSSYGGATKKPRLSGTNAASQSDHDASADEEVNIDQLERLTTPQRLSSSTRRSTKSFGNTPVKTPVDKISALPPRRVRSVIGITGVDLETRGVIECAVHAIDASMVAEPGYRKARVVKSVDYSAAVTHLIVGEDTKRTIKVLFAIARGAWIVSEAWVFSSLEQEQWLPEENYELAIHANKFARTNPEARQIFKGMKFFVGSNVEPSREVLQSLLQCAGGEICNQISVADMCICGDGSLFRRAQRTGVRVVAAKWVFDSIGAMKLEDDQKYGLSTASYDAAE